MGRVKGYKINIQKSALFLYTNNRLLEREIKKIIPFIMTSKIIEYLEIHLTKAVKDLNTENYKTLMKEIEQDTKKERYFMLMDSKN